MLLPIEEHLKREMNRLKNKIAMQTRACMAIMALISVADYFLLDFLFFLRVVFLAGFLAAFLRFVVFLLVPFFIVFFFEAFFFFPRGITIPLMNIKHKISIANTKT